MKKIKIKKFSGFTLIETLVAVAVLGILMVTLGGIMTMSFKAKDSTGNNESMSSKAVFILGELKKNILDAQKGEITCPDINTNIGNSISFMTKSGGSTTLLCDEVTGQIASASAEGVYNYLDNNVVAKNCQDFVWCNIVDDKILSVGFSLYLTTGSGSVGNSGIFYGEVVPRD
ncbi:MAG: type II secretion system protein [Candidatus Shapirobacteria bacterium]|jgi:prepilin-type N-terminal cleavage/methylation domain-containing protein